MAQDKHQSDEHYIEEELALAQQDTTYGDAPEPSAEQSVSPESMHKRHNSHRGGKTITVLPKPAKGY